MHIRPRLPFVFALVFTLSQGLQAQTYNGRVTNANGKPLASVSVVLKAGKAVKAFARTAKEGQFSLTNGSNTPADTLQFSLMGYATYRFPTASWTNGQTIVLQEQATLLKEVTVKSAAIAQRGDTLDYFVNAYRQKQDRTISDVLKRMEGIDVNKDGQITFQGKAINRFYVEGMDLMGNRYAMVSENLGARKVKKVQVLRNHQPTKALKKVEFSEQAALNIVLEDAYKSVWQLMADIATGLTLQGDKQWLRNTRALAMMFGRKMQSLTMYKTDNTGKDIRREIKPMGGFEDGVETQTQVVPNISLIDNGLDEERYRFNNTHVAATNWLFKTKHDADLRLQLTALKDDNKARQETRTLYKNMAADSLSTVTRDATAISKAFSAELLYRLNSEKFFLTNLLTGYINFNEGHGTEHFNGLTRLQDVAPHKRYVTDNFRLIRNIDNQRLFSLRSKFAFSALPSTLLLAQGQSQRLDLSRWHWTISTAFRHKLWMMSLTYTLGAEFNRQRMELNNLLAHSVQRYDEHTLFLSPTLSYENRQLHINASFPMHALYRCFNATKAYKLLAQPSLFCYYTPTPQYKLYLSYNYGWQPEDATTAAALPLFTSQNAAQSGTGELDFACQHSFSARATYDNVLHGLFATLGANHTINGHERLYTDTYNVAGAYYLRQQTSHTSHTYFTRIEATLAKRFYWMKLTFKLTGDYSWYAYNALIQGIKMPFDMKAGNSSLTTSIRPTPWLSLEERSHFSLSRQRQNAPNNAQESHLRHFSHQLKACLMPGNWLLEWESELYHSNDNSLTNTLFSDLRLAYKNKRWEFRLTLNNIFGKKVYEQRIFSEVREIFTHSILRPRQVVAHMSFAL